MLGVIKQYMPISLTIKMLFAGFLTALGGSGYVGFLSEYATYFYAWNNDFRLPAEGSPYLKVTITSISFMLILSSALLFTCIYITLEVFRRANAKIEVLEKEFIESKSNPSKAIRNAISIYYFLNSTGFKKPVAILSLGASLFVALLTITSIYNAQNITITTRVLLSSMISICYMIAILPFLYSKYSISFSLTFTIIFLLISPFILFNQEIYSRVLREIGYGGGMEIQITQDNTKTKNELLLRTTNSIFIKTEKSIAKEIPLDRIDAIDYLPKKIQH